MQLRNRHVHEKIYHALGHAFSREQLDYLLNVPVHLRNQHVHEKNYHTLEHAFSRDELDHLINVPVQLRNRHVHEKIYHALGHAFSRDELVTSTMFPCNCGTGTSTIQSTIHSDMRSRGMSWITSPMFPCNCGTGTSTKKTTIHSNMRSRGMSWITSSTSPCNCGIGTSTKKIDRALGHAFSRDELDHLTNVPVQLRNRHVHEKNYHALEHAFSRDELDHLINVSAQLWNCHVQDCLCSAVLDELQWYELPRVPRISSVTTSSLNGNSGTFTWSRTASSSSTRLRQARPRETRGPLHRR